MLVVPVVARLAERRRVAVVVSASRLCAARCYDSPEVKATAFGPELPYAEPAVFGKALALAALEGLANSHARCPQGRKRCPACAHGFEQVAVDLVVFDAGREQFPNSVVVGESAILAGGRRIRPGSSAPTEREAF